MIIFLLKPKQPENGESDQRGSFLANKNIIQILYQVTLSGEHPILPPTQKELSV
jgi:hypothetical protein